MKELAESLPEDDKIIFETDGRLNAKQLLERIEPEVWNLPKRGKRKN